MQSQREQGQKEQSQREPDLTPYLSRTGAWAFSLGTSIGWGSLVVTSNTYLAQAGPAGSALGLILGALIMLVISRNYSYLMSCYPDAGGAYTFCKEAMGHDHGFLAAWFLSLTYLAVLWANATSLPLFARYFLGDMFRFGKLYEIFGYEVYLGEALLSIVFLLLTALLLIRSKKAAAYLMIGMAVLFTAGIVICFCGAFLQHGGSFEPAFVPDKGALGQLVKIAIISPWAFIGFENISHFSGEFTFRQNRFFRVMVVSVITTTLLYILILLLSVTAYPEGYSSWLEYIRDLGNLEGIEALPAFYAAYRYLGNAGIGLLMAALLALILTSLIGNMTALSRLFYALGKDRVLPPSVGQLNRRDLPARAVMLAAGISLVIPFFGRTAIGWIVDVTTLGATLTYGIVSAAAFKTAGFRNDKTEKYTGLAGIVIMIGFGIYLLVPSLYTTGGMEPETYFLFVAWAVLGFVFFRLILKHDERKLFGRSIIVWIALLSLILFVSLVWMNQSIMNATDSSMREVEAVYTAQGLTQVQEGLVAQQLSRIHAVSAGSITVVVLLFALALGVLINNYRAMSRKAEHSEQQLGRVWDLAGRDPLTGVKSRLAYIEAEKELNESIENGSAEPFAVAVLDVNGLKKINDTLGHQAGDEHIRNACHMICLHFAHSPVFRTGGDEFVVLMSGDDYERRHDILECFRQESEAHIQAGDVVVSAGCADYRPGKDLLLQPVFERADAQMYDHKKYLKSIGAEARL